MALDARYNRTAHGWFDSGTFSDWFERHLLPHLKKQAGIKVVVGDNLSSHFQPQIIKICIVNDIKFVCLPPNTTHLTQPLDVAFFGPLKRAWKSILNEWKDSPSGQKSPTLGKENFAPLLTLLLEKLAPNSGENLRAGFKKCGIVPVDKAPILARMPPEVLPVTATAIVGEAFIDHLLQRRVELIPKKGKKKETTSCSREKCFFRRFRS